MQAIRTMSNQFTILWFIGIFKKFSRAHDYQMTKIFW